MRSRSAVPAVPAVALLVALSVACDGAEEPAPDRRARPEPGDGVQAVTPARYVTDVTFVPFAPDAPRLHYRFQNVTSSDSLRRAYGGWSLDADGWRTLLAARDAIPLPRAGWRVLPTRGLRVVVGDDGGLRAVVRRDSASRRRLELGRTVAEWQGPTGQRELLRLSTLTSGGDRPRRGLALVRRSVLALDVPPPRGLYGFLLVADSTGDGLVVLRQGGTPPGRRPPRVDTTSVAHSWTGGEHRTWRQVRLEAAGAGASEATAATPPAAGWSLDLPTAGIEGRLRIGSLRPLAEHRAIRAAGDAGDGEAGAVRLYGVSGTLTVRGASRPVRGVGVEAGEP